MNLTRIFSRHEYSQTKSITLKASSVHVMSVIIISVIIMSVITMSDNPYKFQTSDTYKSKILKLFHAGPLKAGTIWMWTRRTWIKTG